MSSLVKSTIRGLRGLVLLSWQVRRVAVALERLQSLYEADLASRRCFACGADNSVILPDKSRVGKKESQVELSYGVQPKRYGEVEGDAESFEDLYGQYPLA